MVSIAIDGACRRNGKPDCVSAGGIFITIDAGDTIHTEAQSVIEYRSTNQRGELNALILALKYLVFNKEQDAVIFTDSEYLLNALNNEWVSKWAANRWTLLSGEPVKNADLWIQVNELLLSCSDKDVAFYHIKGHVIPFGEVTASKLLRCDPSGYNLYNEVLNKYDKAKVYKADNIKKACELSIKNNGFSFAPDTLKKIVAMNIVVDAVATEAVNEADRKG